MVRESRGEVEVGEDLVGEMDALVEEVDPVEETEDRGEELVALDGRGYGQEVQGVLASVEEVQGGQGGQDGQDEVGWAWDQDLAACRMSAS